MNEQQLADLFSEQLDQILLGQAPVVPAEAADLPNLLNLGQQFSNVDFQLGPAGQMAFQNQLADWFGPAQPPASALAGLSKPWIMGLILAVTLVGSGVVAWLLWGASFYEANPVPAEIPAELMPEAPVITSPDEPPVSLPDTVDSIEEPALPESPAETTSSEGDVVPAVTSSQGDVLPSPAVKADEAQSRPTFSLKDSLSLPVDESGTVTETDGTVGTGSSTSPEADGEATGGQESENGSGDGVGDGVKGTDNDRGHGNDVGGFDPDNPGNSTGVGGGDSGFDLEKLGRGENGGGQSGGSNDGGGKGNGGNKGGGKGKGKNK